MADIECIDPQVGSWFLGLDEASVQQEVGVWAWEPTVAIGVRVHLSSCPSCQAEYPNAIETIESLRPAIEAMVRKTLLKKRTETLAAMNSCSIAPNELPDCFAQKLAVLEASAEDVQWALFYSLRICRTSPSAPILMTNPHSECHCPAHSGFITTLDIQLQTFIFESILCNEIFWPLRRKFYRMMSPVLFAPDPEDPLNIRKVPNEDYVGEVEDHEAFIRTRLTNAIASTSCGRCAVCSFAVGGLRLSAKITAFGTALSSNTGVPPAQLDGPLLLDRIALQELRSEMADSFDSLKAGQMELRRLIDINSRSAAAYEDEIELQLGSVYPLLNAKTQQLLQQAEYQ